MKARQIKRTRYTSQYLATLEEVDSVLSKLPLPQGEYIVVTERCFYAIRRRLKEMPTTLSRGRYVRTMPVIHIDVRRPKVKQCAARRVMETRWQKRHERFMEYLAKGEPAHHRRAGKDDDLSWLW